MLKKSVDLKMITMLLAIGLACTSLTSTVFAQTRMCVQLFDESPFKKLEPNLYLHYQNETQGLSVEKVRELNFATLTSLNSYIPLQQSHRAQTISWLDGFKLLSATFNHPVVGYEQVTKYSRENEEMGYCFGRAMYIHLTLLKMGLQKESIQKIWAVGPMKSTSSPEISWGYHVATIAFSKEEGWIVLDANEANPLKVEDWMNAFTPLSLDQKLRFYITDANKQALYTDKYSPYLLGLNLSREDDWFKNYFVDMLASVRTESLQSLGLHKINIQSSYLNLSQTSTENQFSVLLKKIKEYFLY